MSDTVKVTVAKVQNGFIVISGTDSDWGPSDTVTNVFTDMNGVVDFIKGYDFSAPVKKTDGETEE